MRARPRSRGVTLIELIVALSVGLIVLAALFYVVQGQQAAYYEGHLQRGAQGAARSALQYVEERVAIAGYGMDSTLAFDFDRYVPATCPAQAAPCVRDSTAGNDELVFHARNPNYWVPATYTPPPAPQPVGNAWRLSAVAPGSITIEAHGGDVFRRGQILQAVCRGSEAYAYFTVAQTIPPVPGDPVANPIVPTVIPLVPSTAANPFARQAAFPPQAGATHPCFTNAATPARVFRIDRFRFHVRPVPSPGGFRPYLVLDQGIDTNGDGEITEADETIIAEGVEVFQVGYVLTNRALLARGTNPGVPIAFRRGTALTAARAGDGITTLDYPGDLALITPAQNEYGPSTFSSFAVGPPAADERTSDHQANIRAVRIFIQARGPDPDPGVDRRTADIHLPMLNQTALPAWIDPAVAYNRTRLDSTVLVRNATSRDVPDF